MKSYGGPLPGGRSERPALALSSSWPLALLISFLPAVQGCLWIPGTAVAIWVTSDNDDGSPAGEPALPSTEEIGDAVGPFLLLDSDPVAVVLGDFIGEVEGRQNGAGPQLDAAVIFRGGQSIAFYRGDGTGRLVRHSTVPVSARNTVALAAVPSVRGGTDGLLVATSQTLELIRWDSRARDFETPLATPLGGRPDSLRDLLLLDPDGGPTHEIAVSSYLNGWVEFFRMAEDLGQPMEEGRMSIPNPPISIAASDFPSDPIYQGYQRYLAVLTEDAGGNALLLYLQGPTGEWESRAIAELRLNEPSFALAKGNHNLDGDNLTPDILFTRQDGTGIVMVRPPGEQGICNSATEWQLERFRGGGHLSPRPEGVALLHLPGGYEVWDRVTSDASLRSVICSYTDRNGLEVAKTISYPLPGEGRGLAAGDLNGDGHDDLVALSADPVTPALTILLANPPENDGPMDDPFRYPFSDRSGESPQLSPALLDVAFGQANSEQPFLAIADRDNEEALILFLGKEQGEREKLTVLAEERYPGLKRRPVSILAGQFDQAHGDDVVIVARKTIYLLRNKLPDDADQHHFEQEEFGITGYLKTADRDVVGDFDSEVLENDFPGLRLRGASSGLLDGKWLDGKEYPDLVLAVASVTNASSRAGDDFVAVVLNPGLSDARRVSFYRTPDEPRHVALANLNGDGALDLVVSCDRANKLYLLFGDPADPGSFVADPGHPLHPLALDGLKGPNECDEEVEDMAVVHAPPDTPPEDWPIADWIVTSHTDSVQLYRKKNPGASIDSALEFELPCQVYSGSDPESLLVFDLFEDGSGLPDLAILEESGPGRVVFMKHKDLVNGEPSCSLWDFDGLPIPSGAPQHAVPFFLNGDLYLAVANRATQLIQVFRRNKVEGQPDRFPTPQVIPIAKANLQGGPLGMAAVKARDGRFFAALIAEDVDENGGSARVDLISFNPPIPATHDLVDLGLSGKCSLTGRLELPGERPLALLAGEFVGDDDYPDLLVCEASGWAVSYPGRDLEPGDTKMVLPEMRRELFQVPVPLVDWKAVQGIAGPALVALAGEAQVELYSIGGSSPDAKLEWMSDFSEFSIRQIAPGWLHQRKDARQDLFVAVLEPNKLIVEFVRLDGSRAAPREIFSGALGAVGSRDLNGDGTDDLALVEDSKSTLHIFLSNAGKDPFSIHRPVKYSPFALAVALDFLDANADSKVDICFGAKSGEVFVFLGNGAGSFQGPGVDHILFASPDLEALATRDLDGDGRDEILVAAPLPGLIILNTKKGAIDERTR